MAAGHRPPTSLHATLHTCVAHACACGQAGSPATGDVYEVVGASAGTVEVRRHSHRGATPRFRAAQGELGKLGVLDEASVRVKIPLPSPDLSSAHPLSHDSKRVSCGRAAGQRASAEAVEKWCTPRVEGAKSARAHRMQPPARGRYAQVQAQALRGVQLGCTGRGGALGRARIPRRVRRAHSPRGARLAARPPSWGRAPAAVTK